jgi:dethiobiotin synthetase
LLVTGTGTGVGKTVVTAAVAALAGANGRRVAAVKPAQTGVAPGEPGDVDEVGRLAGLAAGDLHELARYALALAPAAAARLAGVPAPELAAVAAQVRELAGDLADDLAGGFVVVEGAGGLLVPYNDAAPWTLADLAVELAAPVLVVVDPALGALSSTALTLEALSHRGLACAGLVLGAWPANPDLACRANVADLEHLVGQPLAGALPAGLGASGPESLTPARFASAARAGLGPRLGGDFDAADFAREHAAQPKE